MSNFRHWAIYMFLIFLPKVISLKCYHCGSAQSFEDCDAKGISSICSSSQLCIAFKAYTTSIVKIETYIKGCAETCSASNFTVCTSPSIKCDVHSCCSSDNCNINRLSNTKSPPNILTNTLDPSLECYECLSTQSFKDCDAKRSSVKCSTPCITGKGYTLSGEKKEAYFKSCAPTSACLGSDMSVCNDPNIKCDVDCCSTNFCNSASGLLPANTPSRSLECYECVSTQSFKDCDAKRSSVKCSTVCIKGKGNTLSGEKKEAYFKSCALTSACLASDIAVCNNPNIKCDVDCCSTNFCNNASTLRSMIIPSRSFECYKCLSTHSFGDCDAKRSKVKCSSACIKVKSYALAGTKKEAYAKSCSSTCSAADIAVCKDPNIKCDVDCCSSEYCNGAFGPVVSKLLFIVITIAYLFGFQDAF